MLLIYLLRTVFEIDIEKLFVNSMNEGKFFFIKVEYEDCPLKIVKKISSEHAQYLVFKYFFKNPRNIFLDY